MGASFDLTLHHSRLLRLSYAHTIFRYPESAASSSRLGSPGVAFPSGGMLGLDGTVPWGGQLLEEGGEEAQQDAAVVVEEGDQAAGGRTTSSYFPDRRSMATPEMAFAASGMFTGGGARGLGGARRSEGSSGAPPRHSSNLRTSGARGLPLQPLSASALAAAASAAGTPLPLPASSSGLRPASTGRGGGATASGLEPLPEEPELDGSTRAELEALR